MNERPTCWIKEVRITSSDRHNPRKPSVIPLIKGVNIIHGPSDTGKTYLARSIRFVLAGGSVPFPKETGYDTVTLTLETEHGPATFKRQIGHNQAQVVLPREYGIPRDAYPVALTEATKKQLTVSDILLRLIGITMDERGQRRQIITNQYARKEYLTWRHLHQVLQRAEGNITSETSIFGQERTATLTPFDLIFNDAHHEHTRERRDPREETKRWEILQPEYSEELEKLERRIKELESQLPNESEIESLTRDKSSIEGEIQQLHSSQKELRERLATQVRCIHETEDELTARAYVAEQNEHLASVYLSNISRLSAIIEAQDALAKFPALPDCPTCGASVEADSDEATKIREQAAGELQTLINDLRSLQTAQEALKEKITSTNRAKETLAAEAQNIEGALVGFLQPKLRDLAARVREIEHTTQIAPELNYLRQRKEEVEHRQNEILMLAQEEDDRPFNPLTSFYGPFQLEFTTYLRRFSKSALTWGARQPILTSAPLTSALG